jgi:glutathione S-transferase
MFAPVAQRFLTYAVPVSQKSAAYCQTINSWHLMREWIDDARAEPDEMIELETEF